MPRLGRPEQGVSPSWKAVLENVDINRGVVQQLGGPTAGGLDEVEFRFGSRFERCSVLFELKTSKGALKFRIQGQPRGRWCHGERSEERRVGRECRSRWLPDRLGNFFRCGWFGGHPV